MWDHSLRYGTSRYVVHVCVCVWVAAAVVSPQVSCSEIESGVKKIRLSFGGKVCEQKKTTFLNNFLISGSFES